MAESNVEPRRGYLVRAISSFSPSLPSHLILDAGDVVTVEQVEPDGLWAFGRKKDGKEGLFPLQNVEAADPAKPLTPPTGLRPSAVDGSSPIAGGADDASRAPDSAPSTPSTNGPDGGGKRGKDKDKSFANLKSLLHLSHSGSTDGGGKRGKSGKTASAAMLFLPNGRRRSMTLDGSPSPLPDSSVGGARSGRMSPDEYERHRRTLREMESKLLTVAYRKQCLLDEVKQLSKSEAELQRQIELRKKTLQSFAPPAEAGPFDVSLPSFDRFQSRERSSSVGSTGKGSDSGPPSPRNAGKSRKKERKEKKEKKHRKERRSEDRDGGAGAGVASSSSPQYLSPSSITANLMMGSALNAATTVMAVSPTDMVKLTNVVRNYEGEDVVDKKRGDKLSVVKRLRGNLQDFKHRKDFSFSWGIIPEAQADALVHSARIPKRRVKPMVDDKLVYQIMGPDTEFDQTYQDVASARTVSTYPNRSSASGGGRDGDPICDRYHVQLFPNRCLVALADGCNWGDRPRLAALRASGALMSCLSEYQGTFRLLSDVVKCLLKGFEDAHVAVCTGEEEIWNIGSTTLVGGALLQLEPDEAADGKSGSNQTQWGFVCCSVGDCKVFRWNAAKWEIQDVTAGNRQNLSDAKDPGGRLGPYVDDGQPDLRNLNVYFTECQPNDMLLLLSDGVHDNLDPQQLGLLPGDMLPDGLAGANWEEAAAIDAEKTEAAKTAFQCNFLKENIFQPLVELDWSKHLSPQTVTNAVIKYCVKLTRPSRKWMEEHPDLPLPHDYEQYPGKLDHTTCVCIKVKPSLA